MIQHLQERATESRSVDIVREVELTSPMLDRKVSITSFEREFNTIEKNEQKWRHNA